MWLKWTDGARAERIRGVDLNLFITNQAYMVHYDSAATRR